MSRSFIVTKLELFSRYIYFFSLFSFLNFPSSRIESILRTLWRFDSPIWDKVVRFVVERAERIMELNEEANEQSSPSLFFIFRTEALRHNFTFRPRRGMKVNWRNWCHAAVAILTLYGREGEKYWRSERSSGPCPVENKHHPAAAIPRYLIVSASVWSVSRRHGLSLRLFFPNEYVRFF